MDAERIENNASKTVEQEQFKVLTPQEFGFGEDSDYELSSPLSPTTYYSAVSSVPQSPPNYNNGEWLGEECSPIARLTRDLESDEELLLSEDELVEASAEHISKTSGSIEEEDSKHMTGRDHDYDKLMKSKFLEEKRSLMEELSRAPKLPSPIALPPDEGAERLVHDPMGLFRKDTRLEQLAMRHNRASYDARKRVSTIDHIDDDSVTESDLHSVGEIRQEAERIPETYSAPQRDESSRIRSQELEAIERDKATMKKRQSLKYILKGLLRTWCFGIVDIFDRDKEQWSPG